jgi:hypothetical protein
VKPKTALCPWAENPGDNAGHGICAGHQESRGARIGARPCMVRPLDAAHPAAGADIRQISPASRQAEGHAPHKAAAEGLAELLSRPAQVRVGDPLVLLRRRPPHHPRRGPRPGGHLLRSRTARGLPAFDAAHGAGHAPAPGGHRPLPCRSRTLDPPPCGADPGDRGFRPRRACPYAIAPGRRLVASPPRRFLFFRRRFFRFNRPAHPRAARLIPIADCRLPLAPHAREREIVPDVQTTTRPFAINSRTRPTHSGRSRM